MPATQTASGEPGRAQRPLAISADTELVDDLVRLAAAGGTELELAPDLGAARAAWAAAPLVVVGADAARAGAPYALPRRDGVVLVDRDGDATDVWRSAVAVGATDVALLPGAEATLVERFADTAEGGAARAPCVAVIGGRGGAGASVLATALAVTAARQDRSTVLVDADPLGGGIDLALGAEEIAGIRWPDLTEVQGRLRGASLQAALPSVDGLALLSWDRGDPVTLGANAMAAVLDAARRRCDLVVVDVARHLDVAAERALTCATTALLVVPAEVRAVAAAGRVAAAVSVHCADVRVAVRGPSPSRLDATAVAEAMGLPLAGPLLRPEPGLPAAIERGEPPVRRGRGPLASFCATLLDALPDAGASAAA